MIAAKRYYITGRVQGVSFRFFTLRSSCTLGITGFVRNLNDGRVEILAQGTRTALESFYDSIKKGPPAARVDHIEIVEEQPDSKYTDFQITY
ncbi:MAG: acylphosphatase [Acidobacteria bacterium]|nr:acylphosphatase [Acidobacteriota bacterium]